VRIPPRAGLGQKPIRTDLTRVMTDKFQYCQKSYTLPIGMTIHSFGSRYLLASPLTCIKQVMLMLLMFVVEMKARSVRMMATQTFASAQPPHLTPNPSMRGAGGNEAPSWQFAKLCLSNSPSLRNTAPLLSEQHYQT
jgi:hypothetical protein